MGHVPSPRLIHGLNTFPTPPPPCAHPGAGRQEARPRGHPHASRAQGDAFLPSGPSVLRFSFFAGVFKSFFKTLLKEMSCAYSSSIFQDYQNYAL